MKLELKVMNKEFVPYEIALKLKELGFNEPCFAMWTKGLSEFEYGSMMLPRIFSSKFRLNDTQSCQSYVNNPDTPFGVAAPTFSQAFKFFREKCNLISNLQYYGNWNFEIFRITELAEPIDDLDINYTFKGGTYEEAELECLKKLIELCKKN